MAKLVLPKSAYNGIPGVKKCQKLTSPEYEKLAEEATKRIREKQLQQAKAAKDAENYFCKLCDWRPGREFPFFVNFGILRMNQENKHQERN